MNLYIPRKGKSFGGSMKIIAILLSCLISFNVMASSVKSLESLLDEYHYTLTVEWDQKDQEFYNSQTDLFVSNLSKLIKDQGLTKEQILSLAESKINNAKAFEALKLKLSLLSPATSSSELAANLREASKDFYSNGASWSGDTVITSVLIGLALLAIGYSIWFYSTHECIRWEEVYRCETNEYCRSYSSGRDNDPSYCTWWQEETTCGYEDVCRQWQKKK